MMANSYDFVESLVGVNLQKRMQLAVTLTIFDYLLVLFSLLPEEIVLITYFGVKLVEELLSLNFEEFFCFNFQNGQKRNF